MKSIITRLEELEKLKPSELIFSVELPDGTNKRVSFDELMALRKEPEVLPDGTWSDGLPRWRIIEGNDLTQIDKLLEIMS